MTTKFSQKIAVLSVVSTLLASIAWGADARPPQSNGDAFRVTRGGQTALVEIFDVSPNARLMVRIPEDPAAKDASGLLIRQGEITPVTVQCALARTGAKQPYIIKSCTGAPELAAFGARLQQDVPRLSLDAALDPSLKGIDPDDSRKSAEGDNCRAYCDYQWQWGIFACWLFNPTGGCYDEVNLYAIACNASCPL